MLVSMRLLATLALVFATTVAACGGDDSDPAPAGWNGPQFPYPENGVLPVDEFRAYAAAVDEDWEHEPASVAREYVHRADAAITVQGAKATVLRESLEDDSVRAERYVLELERDGEVWELVSARRDQRCHQGRGHQGFTPELCI